MYMKQKVLFQIHLLMLSLQWKKNISKKERAYKETSIQKNIEGVLESAQTGEGK